MDFVHSNKEFVSFFRFCHAPDELFFQTILMNSPFRDRTADYLRYIDWSKTKIHPRFLDTDEDLERLRVSQALFARKIDVATSPVFVERIDRELRGE
jgi:hypothetical protein